MRKNFTLFIVSDVISQFSAGLILIALNWYVIDTYRSNSLVAIVANINVVAGLVVSFVSLKLFKQINAKQIALLSYCLRIVCLVLPLLLFQLKSAEQFALYLVALSGGIGWNLYFPASKEILNSFTTKETALKTNALAEVSMQVGLFSATLFSGILYRYIGFENILLFGLILFGMALSLFAFIKYQGSVTVTSLVESNVFIYLARKKRLILLGLVMYLPFIGVSVINTALPGYIREHLAGNSVDYGVTDTLYGLGACLASLLLPTIAKRFKSQKLVLFLFFLATILGTGLVFNQQLSLAAIYIFILGSVDPTIRTLIYTKVTELVPDNLLGSLMTFWNVVNLIFQFGANYSTGKLMDAVGAKWGFSVYAGLMLVGCVSFLSIQKTYRKSKKA